MQNGRKTEAPKAQDRGKLAAPVSRCERACKRAGESSVTFHEKGGAAEPNKQYVLLILDAERTENGSAEGAGSWKVGSTGEPL